MLVFSAICPHPPIIIPSIGKDNLDKVEKTVNAMKELEKELVDSKPDVIVIISPHGQLLHDAFSINLNPSYQADFEDFGDFDTKLAYSSDLELSQNIKEQVESELPIVLNSYFRLDHGVGVPLYYLTKNLKNIKIIPINYCLLDHEKHVKFGQLIKKEIAKSKQRVAVIASGDLSHCLIKGAPAGYSPEGEKFDKEFVKLLNHKNYNEILKMDEKFIEDAAECGLRSFLILFGIIREYNHDVEIISYEGPLGVGYLVANFKLK